MIPPPGGLGGGSPGNALGVNPSGTEGPGGGGKKNMPPPQDYIAAGQAQTQANRPNQTNAFGASSSWSIGPDGRPTQTSSFGGPLGDAVGSLSGQVAAANANPLDLDALPGLQYGEDARKAAVESGFGQARSRLDPMWDAREEATRTRLLNQGLDPESAASQKAMGDFERARTDAYDTALASAISRGGEEAQRMFGQSATARGMTLSEQLQKRNLPLEQLRGIQGLGGQAGFAMDQGLNAAGMQGAQAWQRYLQEQGMLGDVGGGIGQVLGAAGALLPVLLSDARTKMNVEHLPVGPFPGVQWATFEYRHAPGRRAFGVIAQELERVRPDMVVRRGDGLLLVDYGKLMLEVGHG